MTLRDLQTAYPGSNGRKSMVLAIRALIADGDEILREEFQAHRKLYTLQRTAASAEVIEQAHQELLAWRAKRRAAENEVRARFGMRAV